MKTDKIEISKIKIQVKDTKLELSLEEARELKLVLEQLFPNPVIQYVQTAPWKYWDYTTTPFITTTTNPLTLPPQVYCANLSLNAQ